MEKVLTIEEAKIEFESHMLIALFKAAVEQSTLLTGKYKQKMKQDFNKWQKIDNPDGSFYLSFIAHENDRRRKQV